MINPNEKEEIMEAIKLDFDNFLDSLEDGERERINKFFAEFDLHFVLSKSEKRKFRYDFESAIMTLVARGATVDEVLSRLELSNLGGFYARPSVMWFSLDDAAKIYPVSMEHGRQMVFRLSVYLKEDVSPEILQMALNFTIKRFPNFATTLKKGFFWHYFDSVKKHFAIKEESDAPCQPIKVSMSGSTSFRVTYYKNRVSAEFFHALTDGTGGITFLKALTAEYLRLLGVQYSGGEECDLWDINETPMKEEFENSFLKVEKAKSASGFVDKAALQMNGRLTRRKPCRILHFNMDSDKLLSVARSYGTTVTGYLLSQMFLATAAACDELTGDIHIQVPVNMRKYYPSRTMRNFSMYCGVRIPIDRVAGREELIREISSQLAEKSKKEKMHEMITAAVGIVSAIRFIPLLIKQPVAKMVYGFLGEKVYTTTFSNLGVVKMPSELTPHIEKMDFCLGAQMTNRLACTAITFGSNSTFTVSKMTQDPAFEEKMYKLLVADGLDVLVEGSEFYAR